MNENLPEYLRRACENAQENLTSEQSEQVKTLRMKHYKDVFAKNKTDLDGQILFNTKLKLVLRHQLNSLLDVCHCPRKN